MPCYVCESPVIGLDEHHIVMRAQGGEAGPTVDLCPTCHSTIHRSANRLLTGKSCDDLIAHLNHESQSRAMILIKVILAVESSKEDRSNPNPLLAVKLDRHAYLVALNLLQKDRGFSSREAMLNELLRQIAIQYGLVGDLNPQVTRITSLKELRKVGKKRLDM